MSKPEELQDHMQGFCLKCPHRETCERPCPPVYKYANKGWRAFEKELDTVVVVFPGRKREIRFSALEEPDAREPYEPSAEAHHEFWGTLHAQKKRTGIFVDRFVNKWDWEDIAVKYDCDVKTAMNVYCEARNQLMKLVEVWDRPAKRNHLAVMEGNSGRFSQRVKAFLLAKCLDMSTVEIAALQGRDPNNVGRDIKACAQEIRAGRPVLVFEGEDLDGRGVTWKESCQHTYQLKREAKRAAQA